MYMKACEDLEMGRPIASQIPPIAAALSDCLLSSRCSACFFPLSLPRRGANYYTCNGECGGSVFYCSQNCINADHPLHIQCGECHFMSLVRDLGPNSWQGNKSFSTFGGTCDLRAALRLLFHHQRSGSLPDLQSLHANPRIGNLMSNREKLLHNGHQPDTEIAEVQALCQDSAREMTQEIKEGARLMLLARQLGGICRKTSTENYGQRLEEEALCQVITNGVQVLVDEQLPTQSLGNGLFQGELQYNVLGTAVYGPIFSWCNHSCRPNACYSFQLSRAVSDGKEFSSESQEKVLLEDRIYMKPEFEDCNIFCFETKKAHGPRVALQTIKRVAKGEEIFITYTDLMQPKKTRQVELWLNYRFVCHCERCDTSSLASIDQILQETKSTNMPSSISGSNSYETRCIEVLMNKISSGISEFVLDGDPSICCKSIEDALEEIITPKGFVTSEKQLQTGRCFFKIHPLHRLCLDAYTALASVYRIRATDTLHCSLNKSQPNSCFVLSTPELSATTYADNSESVFGDHDSNAQFYCSILDPLDRRHGTNFRCQKGSLSELTVPPDSQFMAKHKCDNCALMRTMQNDELIKSSEFNRAAAAYSLLLAGAVQHVFHAGEWGLIITAARSWLNAGEGLLRWIMTCDCPLAIPKMQQFSFKNWLCSNLGSASRWINCDCLFQNEYIRGAPGLCYSGSGIIHTDKEASIDEQKLLSCMNKFLKLAWPSLRSGLPFLEAIQNPVDYDWLGDSEEQCPKHFFLQDEREGRNQRKRVKLDECSYGQTPYSGLLKSMPVSNQVVSFSTNCMREQKLIAIQCAIHCMFYSKYLTGICYGSDHPLVYNIQNTLSVIQNVSINP